MNDLLKSLAQLPEKRIRAGVLWSLLFSLTVFVILIVVAWWLLGLLAMTGYDWIDWFTQLLGTAGVLTLAWFGFPFVMTGFVSLFADRICQAVETRHYPGLSTPRNQPLVESILQGIWFAIWSLGINILALPLYLLPGPNVIVFLALNGFILGREYFETVALRHLSPADSGVLRRRKRFAIWLAGIPIAAIFMIPVVNLLAPVIGVSLMTHRFHRALLPASGNTIDG